MSEQDSVTEWLMRLRTGESGQGRDMLVQRLWERYFTDMVNRAHKLLQNRKSLANSEDVALSAFAGVVRGIERSRFPKLNGRNDFWQILLHVTRNKVKNSLRSENQYKRGRGHVIQALPNAHSDMEALQIPDRTADPAEIVALVEEVERLLQMLNDGELRQVAELVLAEYTNAEIAAEIGKSIATVERKRARIRSIWSNVG